MKKLKNPKKFAHDLCDWYKTNKRDLPFRHSKDPYHIFVSELMLQQTQIKTMLPYYYRFIEKFPTIKALATAKSETVLKYWEGLGYYSRARYLHESANKIVNEFNGTFPKNLKDIESLKGVGRYTARAIHSIAYNQPSVAVDGNVMRVMSRVLLYDKDIRKTKHMREIETILEPVIIHEDPSVFTQALMELGALICKKTPECEKCPLKDKCFAYKENKQANYPVSSKLKAKTQHNFTTFVIRYNDKYLLRKRPSKGLLANMYEFPQFESPFDDAVKHIATLTQSSIKAINPLTTINHIFTHKVWNMKVYEVVLDEPSTDLVSLNSFPRAISKAHQKIIDVIKEKNLPF